MTRHAYCHFCDDIRYEVGNKVSAMGMYSGELLVQDIPATLPKFCVLAFCSTAREKPFKSLGIRLEMGGVVIQELELPSEALVSFVKDADSRDDPSDPFKKYSLGSHIMVAPFHIASEGTLTVTVIADKDEMVAGKLRIRRLPQETQARA
ncbi:hypothetical protein [Ralstonia pseudosolanacearum]|uniref:hypothetical protein n=1 Tax=Ralstonia pseudosolanacearum TaxID=1310165 RepID=UPI00267545D6|nr:hypothetical protein [Ralstonia pseudosolanacearum]MDO3524525.1 hypothetical protein [Ralstonia pseudosolanacearum]MDO3552425.1 hypothetical protein [Ralstonia pseudosolanacearum]MDO3591246.1 hypothetical protein [Ralstonia pseudosolanacearum]MDO3595736.1 hypothetical protein [Ralstonia pseudosolanacearum]MDO3601257.1 hypothetical protein [Ralstonia pseudosolanacearum]